jgi:hypothetical protein
MLPAYPLRQKACHDDIILNRFGRLTFGTKMIQFTRTRNPGSGCAGDGVCDSCNWGSGFGHRNEFGHDTVFRYRKFKYKVI